MCRHPAPLPVAGFHRPADDILSRMATSLCCILEDPHNAFVSVEVGMYGNPAVLELPRELSVPRTFHLCLRTTDLQSDTTDGLCCMVHGCGDLRLYAQAVGDEVKTAETVVDLILAARPVDNGPTHARVVIELTNFFRFNFQVGLPDTVLWIVILISQHLRDHWSTLDVQDRDLPPDGRRVAPWVSRSQLPSTPPRLGTMR